MKVVLDTNVLLVSITSKSMYYPVFESFVMEEYDLCVTTEILLEYEEILNRYVGKSLATDILSLIQNAPNTVFINRYFEWNLIKIDPDDNKFVDCAIAASAQLIVTEDRHFDVLRTVPFPKVIISSLEPFIIDTLQKQLNL